jgi:putative transposase
MENGFIESFNGQFRDECPNENWFLDVTDAREKIETWRCDYNQARPHSALGARLSHTNGVCHRSAGSSGGERAVKGLALENRKVVSY